MTLQDAVDVAIIGGGTAGALLAGRLAEGTDATILLVEDGPDIVHPLSRRLADQPQILRSDALRRMPERRPDGGGATLLSGALIGGGWSVNHGVMMFPTAGDVAALQQVGGEEWSAERVRMLARRITTDRDRATAGDREPGTGPIPLARPLLDPTAVAPATAALFAACADLGVPWSDDVNRDGMKVTVSSYPYSSDDGERVSSATAILGPARIRPNLQVLARTFVRRLIVHGSRVVAIEYVPEGSSEPVQVRVDRVVLSAGVFHTPQILLRSGIGPSDHVRDCGITPVLDLPGVGEGLFDHAKIEPTLQLHPKPDDRPASGQEAWASDPFGDDNKVHLRLMSSFAREEPDLDLQLRHDVTAATTTLTVRILEQRAAGTVRLDPTDVDGPPVIDAGMAQHPDDVKVLVEGIRRGVELLEHPLLEGRYRRPETLPWDDEGLAALVRAAYGSYNHGVGTCRMGNDLHAVVDTGLRLHGLDNVHIVDASVLPALPHVTTNYPVAIVAQWAAERFLTGSVDPW